MRKRYLHSISLIVVVMVLSFSVLAPKSAAVGTKDVKSSDSSVISLTQNNTASKVLETRFLNMLNHNYVYDDTFFSEEAIVNNSIIALLSLKDKQNDSFISENYVKDYVYNMYGIEINDFSEINKAFPHLDGFVYVIPRGFTKYSHRIDSVKLNEDGSYTVITKVQINPHDSDLVDGIAKTLFVKNESSQFGFSIISSDITENVDNM